MIGVRYFLAPFLLKNDFLFVSVKLLDVLKNKTEKLAAFKKENSVRYILSVVIKVKSSQTPAMYITEESISFISSIGVSIDIDLYV